MRLNVVLIGVGKILSIDINNRFDIKQSGFKVWLLRHLLIKVIPGIKVVNKLLMEI